MRVRCEVEDVTLTNDEGRAVPGVCVRCGECGEEAEVFGQSKRSVKRGAIMLKEQCPRDESNYYAIDDEDERP